MRHPLKLSDSACIGCAAFLRNYCSIARRATWRTIGNQTQSMKNAPSSIKPSPF